MIELTTKWLLQKLNVRATTGVYGLVAARIAGSNRWMDAVAARPGEATIPRIRLRAARGRSGCWYSLFSGQRGLDQLAVLARRKGVARGQAVPGGVADGACAAGDVHAVGGRALGGADGLPYLTILVDDSASQRIADQYEKPEERAALEAIAAPAKSEQTTRLAIAKGLILKDRSRLIRELEKQHKVRIYRVSNSAQLLAEVDRPTDIAGAEKKLLAVEAAGSQSRLGDAVRQVLTELRGAAVGDRAALRRPDHRG